MTTTTRPTPQQPPRCRICGGAGHHSNPLRLIEWPSVWQHCYVCLLTGFEVEDKEEANRNGSVC